VQANPKRRVRVSPALYQRPKDGKFEAGFTGGDGRWHIVTLAAKTLTDAKREQRALMLIRDRGEDVAPSRLSLADVAADFFETFQGLVVAGEKSERTLELYRQRLRTHLEKPLEESRSRR